MIVTISLSGFVADQMRYSLESFHIIIDNYTLVFNIYLIVWLPIFDRWFHAVILRQSSGRKTCHETTGHR